MPSRMEKYYHIDEGLQRRSNKNKSLYDSIYEDVEYSNVEGISIIEKDEQVDIDKIRELLGYDKPKKEEKKEVKVSTPKTYIEEKNYDINAVLNKAKNERPEEEKLANTQYNILKNLNLEQEFKEKRKIDDDELKNMIETITINSKNGQTADLLDDLKTISSSKMKEEIEEEMDKSFFTSSLGFTSKDFEDLKDIKDEVKKNSLLVKILLFIFSVIIVTGIIFAVYNFILK